MLWREMWSAVHVPDCLARKLGRGWGHAFCSTGATSARDGRARTGTMSIRRSSSCPRRRLSHGSFSDAQHSCMLRVENRARMRSDPPASRCHDCSQEAHRCGGRSIGHPSATRGPFLVPPGKMKHVDRWGSDSTVSVEGRRLSFPARVDRLCEAIAISGCPERCGGRHPAASRGPGQRTRTTLRPAKSKDPGSLDNMEAFRLVASSAE